MVRQIAVILTIVVAVVAAGTAKSEQKPKTYCIGYLSVRSPNMEKGFFPAFRKGLRERGLVEGKNTVIEALYAKTDNRRLPSLAAELLRHRPDVIVTGGGGAALAVKRLTKTVPIVMAEATAPLATGIIANLARPEGNVTGLVRRTPNEFAKDLQLLQEALPGLSRVAVLWNPRGPASTIGWKMLQGPAQELGIRLHSMEVRTEGDLGKAFEGARAAGAQAVFVTPGPRLDPRLIIDGVRRNHLPSFAPAR